MHKNSASSSKKVFRSKQKQQNFTKKQRKGAHARMLRGSDCLGLRSIVTLTPYS
jgi:hypothetical protein